MTGYRVATLDDLDAVTSVMATAFSADPVWGPYSFPDDDRRVEQLARFWRPQLAAAMRFPWTMVTHHCEAAAVWIPPGEPEMSPQEERDLVALTERMLGAAQTRVVFDVFRRLEDAHPDQPHYYLSLLGTHDDHRGRGLGMALLAATLEAVDAERDAGLPGIHQPGQRRPLHAGRVPPGGIRRARERAPHHHHVARPGLIRRPDPLPPWVARIDDLRYIDARRYEGGGR